MGRVLLCVLVAVVGQAWQDRARTPALELSLAQAPRAHAVITLELQGLLLAAGFMVCWVGGQELRPTKQSRPSFPQPVPFPLRGPSALVPSAFCVLLPS